MAEKRNSVYVECPRCRMRRSLALHQVLTSDAQECPRCWRADEVEVPMALYPPGSASNPILDQRIVNRLNEGAF